MSRCSATVVPFLGALEIVVKIGLVGVVVGRSDALLETLVR